MSALLLLRRTQRASRCSSRATRETINSYSTSSAGSLCPPSPPASTHGISRASQRSRRRSSTLLPSRPEHSTGATHPEFPWPPRGWDAPCHSPRLTPILPQDTSSLPEGRQSAGAALALPQRGRLGDAAGGLGAACVLHADGEEPPRGGHTQCYETSAAERRQQPDQSRRILTELCRAYRFQQSSLRLTID